MSCDACKSNAELKQEWGCKQPTQLPIASLICIRCKGEGCERCNQRGEEDVYDCPVKLIRQTSRVFSVLTAYRWLKSHNLLPNPGGWLEQPASLLQAIEIVEDEKAFIERERGRNEELRTQTLLGRSK